MNQQDLSDWLDGQPALVAHKAFILGLAKPSVRIGVTQQGASGVQSQFGGKPMVPADFVWPQHEVGRYYFLGQINFAEIENRPASLPAQGLLSLFYADYDPNNSDCEGDEIFWQDDGYVIANFYEDVSALVQHPAKADAPGRRLTLHTELDLPRHAELHHNWPFDVDLLDALFEGTFVMPGETPPANPLMAVDYLLGWPSHYSLGYDPTPNEGWQSLLTLHSHRQFKWTWHDGDKLMVFIEKNRLAARDFSNLKCDAG